MAIFKKGTTQANKIIDYDEYDIKQDLSSNVQITINKENYKSVFDSASEKGFEEGREKGYNIGYEDGYTKGKELLEKESIEIKEKLARDKQMFLEDIESNSAQYINKTKENIKELITDSIQKIFFDALSHKYILTIYVNNLLKTIKKECKNFSVELNSNTLAACNKTLDDENISFEINESIEDFDVIILTNKENREYFLKDELIKILEVFN